MHLLTMLYYITVIGVVSHYGRIYNNLIPSTLPRAINKIIRSILYYFSRARTENCQIYNIIWKRKTNFAGKDVFLHITRNTYKLSTNMVSIKNCRLQPKLVKIIYKNGFIPIIDKRSAE